MKISAKVDYACRALLELALHWPKETPFVIEEIAKKQKIPNKFLTHILLQLKQLGYVESVRGKRGGYLLAKQPKDINVWDIYVNFSEAILKKSKKKGFEDIIANMWLEIVERMEFAMRKVTFENLVAQQREQGKVISFDI